MSGHKKISMGMIGEAPGSFSGPVHRMAAKLDDATELCVWRVQPGCREIPRGPTVVAGRALDDYN